MTTSPTPRPLALSGKQPPWMRQQQWAVTFITVCSSGRLARRRGAGAAVASVCGVERRWRGMLIQ